MNRCYKMAGIVLVAVLAVCSAGGWIFRTEISTQYAAYQLRTATDSETRKQIAEGLIARGPASSTMIAELMKTGSPEVRTSLLEAVNQLPHDAQYSALALAIVTALPQCEDEHTDAVMIMVSHLAGDPSASETVKTVVQNALKGSVAAKIAACRVATQKGIDLPSAVVPLLADPDAGVRQAAVIAIGPVSAVTVVSEEELFKMLSDPDADVRTVVAAALSTRGLDDRQIALGRKLMHPDAKERMSLLMDLKFAGDTLKDPGPWLARLGKDADPAVRAGAARVAFECRITTGDWLNELADKDPDPLVRQVAGHYRQRTNDIRTVGGFER